MYKKCERRKMGETIFLKGKKEKEGKKNIAEQNKTY
jgi:hypothetical protein